MLRGTLDDFSLPDMFRLMSIAKKTGKMDVTRQAGRGKVYFRDGEVYYAESSLSKEPLGQKLIRARALTEGQLNKALDLHAQTGQRVGDILVDSGMVTPEQIEAAVHQQIEDAIFDLLRWELGDFTWESNAELEVEVPIAVSVENLIMEAARRLDELEVIKRKIPSGATVLTMAHTPPEGAAEINITPDEWRALVLVDGNRTVAEIGAMVRADEFETMRILYGLLSAGLVEVDHDASLAAEAAAAATGAEDRAAEAEFLAAETAPAIAAAEVLDPDELEVEPEAVEPQAVEPEVVEPQAVEPEVVEPQAVEPQAVEPQAVEPQVVEPQVVEPQVVEPEAAEPFEVEAVEPEAFEPEAVEPEAVEPEAVEPAGDRVGAASADDLDVLAGLEEPVAAPDAPPAEWFTEPDVPADEVGVSTVEAEDPFLSDLLEQEASDSAGPMPDVPAAPEPEAPAAPEPAAEESRTVDRAAVARELAGLFDEDPPRPKAGPGQAPAGDAPEGDQRKRVEDDDQINNSVISRLIKGVKGL